MSEDPRTFSEHNRALQNEMEKAKPRDSVLLPLMKNTFNERPIYMQNDATTVKETLEVYSALARPAIVRYSLPISNSNTQIIAGICIFVTSHFKTEYRTRLLY